MLFGMTPAKQGAYRFRKESIAEMRQILGLSQSAMAAMLDLPKNTVSRWERGETTPDAESLAAIYSLGKEKGVEPNFFVSVKQQAPLRDVALVYWDLSGALPFPRHLESLIVSEARKRVPHATREIFKAFLTFPSLASQPADPIWRPKHFAADLEEAVYDQALSDAGQSPSRSVVFLVATNAAYVDLVKDLRDRDARVYLMTMRLGVGAPPELIAAVGRRRWIELA